MHDAYKRHRRGEIASWPVTCSTCPPSAQLCDCTSERIASPLFCASALERACIGCLQRVCVRTGAWLCELDVFSWAVVSMCAVVCLSCLSAIGRCGVRACCSAWEGARCTELDGQGTAYTIDRSRAVDAVRACAAAVCVRACAAACCSFPCRCAVYSVERYRLGVLVSVSSKY